MHKRRYLIRLKSFKIVTYATLLKRTERTIGGV
jgi:hypothetical protein